MKDKKVVALIILAVLAVISLVYGITASPKSRAKSAAVAVGQASGAPAQNAVVAKSVVPTARRAKRSQFKAWKRNPFVSGLAATTLTMTKLTLNGIIWSKTNPKAMIGDAIVVKGDTVGANKVVDIQPDKVILNDGAKDFELKLEK
ncbi:MAG: hypothetical protein Q7S30_01440 [Candidatus Omnitrophota bacterium]|nr:hypothetical protein [Candidatus Omnitrophota bacterium]